MTSPPHQIVAKRRGGQKWLLRWVAALGMFCCSPLSSHSQRTTGDEYEIRAAMLFNLTKFIDWPAWKIDPTTHHDFQVCMMGSDPLGSDLEALLVGKSVQGRPVKLRRLGPADNADECHILYVGASERKRAFTASSELQKFAVLTVSERPNSDNPKQVIGLPIVEEHVHIDVNLGAAQRSGLNISSKLLKLATVTP